MNWFVVMRVDDGPVTVSTFDSHDDAVACYQQARTNWTEVYLCAVQAGPGITPPRSMVEACREGRAAGDGGCGACADCARNARAVAFKLAEMLRHERTFYSRLPNVPISPFDHACAECCVPPYTDDSVVPGFRCAYHTARDWLTDVEG